LDYDHPDAFQRLQRVIDGLRAAAKADRAIAVRIEPRVERDTPASTLFDKVGLHRVDATLQTPDTRLVDLLPDDDALLATFDKDTRYAIRRAEREGVTTAVIDDPNDDQAVIDLHALVTETLDRANYRLPSLERYRAIWRGLAPAGRARIIQARHGDVLEASGLLILEGDRSIYLYAVSSDAHVLGQVVGQAGPQYLVVLFSPATRSPADVVASGIELAGIIFDAKLRNGDWPVVANTEPVRVDSPWFVVGHGALANLRL